MEVEVAQGLHTREALATVPDIQQCFAVHKHLTDRDEWVAAYSSM
jgi:hypothetical protein